VTRNQGVKAKVKARPFRSQGHDFLSFSCSRSRGQSLRTPFLDNSNAVGMLWMELILWCTYLLLTVWNRIEATREMCNLLKNFAAGVRERVEQSKQNLYSQFSICYASLLHQKTLLDFEWLMLLVVEILWVPTKILGADLLLCYHNVCRLFNAW